MTRYLAVQQTEKLLTHEVTGQRPTSSSDGVDITKWKTGGAYSPMFVEVYLSGTTAATVEAPSDGTRGVELWGFQLGRWWFLHGLYNGQPVPIASEQLGSSEQVDNVAGFERLFIAGHASAGSCTAGFVPLEVLL